MVRKNPTSARRSGDDYQDIWGLIFLADWLLEPTRYKWFKYESVPLDEIGSRFSLDDIVICCDDDRFILYQSKHKQDPNGDLWTWQELLKQEPGKKKPRQSLIQKWCSSYTKPELKGKIRNAIFLTNGLADSELSLCLKDQKVTLDELQKCLPDIYAELKRQIVDENRLRIFFAEFEFRFGELSVDDLYSRAEKVYLEQLCATREGFLSLFVQAQKEARATYTRVITLADVQAWCEFDIPRELNQSFEVPIDFQYFDDHIHENFLQRLESEPGGVQILVGRPGSGKSTYLSQLHADLQEKKLLSIRHHYYLTANERTALERLGADRVFEALKAECKKHPSLIGKLRHKNSANINLREFIAEIAKNCREKKQSCFLIIDGLDHVLRYSEPHELRRFLEEICIPQDGLWIILGMQEVADCELPLKIKELCPKRAWIEVFGLSSASVTQLVSANHVGLRLPVQPHMMEEFCEALFEVTEGNPLHLRYCLNSLKNRYENRVVRRQECGTLTPFGGDISLYYQALWETLPSFSKTIAIAVKVVDHPLTSQQLNEVVSLFAEKPSDVSDGKRAVLHLFRLGSRGFEIYHSSFALFVEEQKEWSEQSLLTVRFVVKWLEECNHEYLKWLLIPKLKLIIGDSTSLFNIDRAWLLAAIVFPRDDEDIRELLELASIAAMSSKNYPVALKLALLKGYYLNSIEDSAKAHAMLWVDAFLLHEPKGTPIILSKLSDDEIYQYVRSRARTQDIGRLIEKCLPILGERHTNERFIVKGEIGGASLPSLPINAVKLIALKAGHSVKNVLKYIRGFRPSGWDVDLLSVYSASLLSRNSLEKMSDLLAKRLSAVEESTILRQCAVFDITNQRRSFVERSLKRSGPSDVYVLACLCIMGEKPKSVPSLRPSSQIPIVWPEHRSAQREEISELFCELFAIGIVLGALGKSDELSRWAASLSFSWSHKMARGLTNAGRAYASALENCSAISFDFLLSEIDSIPPLTWPENRQEIELQHGLKIALRKIVELIRMCMISAENKHLLSLSDTKMLTYSRYFDADSLVLYLVSADSMRIEADAVRWLTESQLEIWEKQVTTFSERSERYAQLTRICRLHGENSTAERLLSFTANNIVAYGYHKDMFWYEILKVIEACHHSGSAKAAGWLREIAVNVESVGDYTDGDETSDTDDDLTRLMASVDPAATRARYIVSSESEKFYDAAFSFQCVLRSYEFDDDFEVAVGMTAIDRASRLELIKIARVKSGAAKALTTLDSYGGAIAEHDQVSQSDSDFSPSVPNDENEYMSVHPEVLAIKLKTFDTHYEEQQFLKQWANRWLQTDERGVALETICDYLSRTELTYADSDLLDEIYPRIVTSDPKRAFELVCYAQANGLGWNWYGSSMERSVSPRWKFIKQHFADRYWEFFEESILYSARRMDGRASQGSFPVVRGIQYLLEFGELELCEQLVNACIEFGKTLTANLQLPKVEWLQNAECSTLDVLFRRLVEISPFIRERAAMAIATLLIDSERSVEVFDKLVSWIAMQELETLSALALVPLIRAACFAPQKVAAFDFDQLTKALRHRSIVIDKALGYLEALTCKKIDVSFLPPFVCDTVNANTVASEFFVQNAKYYAEPLIRRAGEEFGAAFLAEWYLSTEKLADRCFVIRDLKSFGGYRSGYSREGNLAGMTVKLSDVYTSAFLRVIHTFYQRQLVSHDDFLEHALKTFPVDFSVWQVEPNRAPKWWPHLGKTASRGESHEIVNLSYESEIERSILHRSDGTTLLFMEGPIKPVNGSCSGLDCFVTLAAFAYRSNGPELPEASELCHFLFYQQEWSNILSRVKRPLAILDDMPSLVPVVEVAVPFDDLEVTPLVLRLPGFTAGLWQWFRNYPSPVALAPIVKSIEIRKSANFWNYQANDQIIATYQDWTEGLQERFNSESYIPFGKYLEAQSSVIATWLSNHNLRLGYVYEIEHRFKENHWDKNVHRVKHHHLIGVSAIII